MTAVEVFPTSKGFVYLWLIDSVMPIIDRRQLLFDVPAIQACLRSLRVASARLELPLIGLQAIRLHEADGHVELSFATESRYVDHSQMAALLISFCRTLSLPIPKEARKELTQVGQCLALVFISEVPLRVIDATSGEKAHEEKTHRAVKW